MNKPLNLVPAYSFTREDLLLISACVCDMALRIERQVPETLAEGYICTRPKETRALILKLEQLINLM